jgi:thioredoxin-related protein
MKKTLVFIFALILALQAAAQSTDSVALQWLSFEEAAKLSEEKPKKIFIDVYTDWCGWCTKMEATTFRHPVIAKLLSENFYPVKLNAEQREDITFKEHTYKFVEQGSRGYHEIAAALLQGKMSYPTVVFLDESFRIIQPVSGYIDPKNFEPILKYIAEGKYTETDWETFLKSFSGEVK